MRTQVTQVVLAAALVAAASCSAPQPAPGTAAPSSSSSIPTTTSTAPPDCVGAGRVERTVGSYRSVPGAAADLTTLEVIRPVLGEHCAPTPVMVWVHGGAWTVGDRRNQLDDKVALFSSLGWTLVSVNYRLSPQVQYPVHNDDVAAALDWVWRHADGLGLDPGRVSVMGHSAGAGILAGVVADQDHLGAFGRSPGELGCAVLLDTEGYDVVAQGEAGNPVYLTAFGTDPVTWAEASPLHQIEPGEPLPDTLVVTRGTAARRDTAAAFTAALLDAGAHAELLDARPLDHAGVNAAVGAAGETIVTPRLVEFLRRC